MNEETKHGDSIPELTLRAAGECRLDVLSLGEVMLRFDPGEDRIVGARSFRVWEGGGEYNVARGLRRCFEQRTAIVTALVDNPIGRLVEDLILQGGVDTSHAKVNAYRTNLYVDDPPSKPLLPSSALAETYSGGPSH
jgi:2-dehydro-3-deoxygluconokinase